MNCGIEVFGFQAEIAELVSHLVASFYKKKDFFLNELLSNASNALDRIRYAALTDPTQLNSGKDFIIYIVPDYNNNTITITDTGIGMTKRELITNFGSVAKSGTKTFIEALRNGIDLHSTSQFGIGFYAVYLVAHKVTVTTKHNSEKPYIWESRGSGEFTLKNDIKNNLKRGTQIVLHIKKNQIKYLSAERLQKIAKDYSQFVVYPVVFKLEKERVIGIDENIDVPETNIIKIEALKEFRNGSWRTHRTLRKVFYFDIKQLNKTKPIWMHNINNLQHSNYAEFYKILTEDYEDHLAVKHFEVDSPVQFRALLFVPRRAPSTLLGDSKKQNNIKLYVRQVFYMDNTNGMLPDYLYFLRGIIDCADVPFNPKLHGVEQKSNDMNTISKHIVKKTIELIEELQQNEHDYKQFHMEYSKYLKLAFVEEELFRERLVELLLFKTSLNGTNYISLMDYIKDCKPNQPGIYYVIGESMQQVITSPLTESVEEFGFDVIYMLDPLDSFLAHFLKVYRGKELISCNKENLLLPENPFLTQQHKADKAKYHNLCNILQQILENHVEKVIVSQRLRRSPCCVVATDYGIIAAMERAIDVQAFCNATYSFGSKSYGKVLELNPESPIIKALNSKINLLKTDAELKNLVFILFDMALLTSGYCLHHRAVYAERIFRMIEVDLHLRPHRNINAFWRLRQPLEKSTS